MFECLVGKPPFTGEAAMDICRKIVRWYHFLEIPSDTLLCLSSACIDFMMGLINHAPRRCLSCSMTIFMTHSRFGSSGTVAAKNHPWMTETKWCQLRKGLSPLVKEDSSLIRANLAKLRTLHTSLPSKVSESEKTDHRRMIENLTSPFVTPNPQKPEIEVGRRCFRQDLHAKFVGFSFFSLTSIPSSFSLRVDTLLVGVDDDSNLQGSSSKAFNEFSSSFASSTLV